MTLSLTQQLTSRGIRPAYLVIISSAVLLCLLLSGWQYQRAQQAEVRYQQYQTALNEAPSELSSEMANYQRVQFSGRINQLFLLDNQILDGQVGWHVLADIDTTIGPLLVNLGWMSQQMPIREPADFPNPISVIGQVKWPETGLMLAPAQKDPAWPGVMQQIDIPLLNQFQSRHFAPFVVYADHSFAGLAPMPVSPENKHAMHIGYALQWLLIALAFVAGLYFACRQEPQHAQQ
jgi:cytochrome oxidase assembly protein ShyY1